MHNYHRLKVWRRARSVTADVYRVTATFPRTELFGLTAQMRRAVISISANLAEGSGRASDQDFARFISMGDRICKRARGGDDPRGRTWA